MSENIVASRVTNEAINNWKKKYGKVFLIKSGDKRAYLRNLNRSEMSLIFRNHKDDNIMLCDAILNTTWLAGDEEIKTNDDLFLGVIGELEKIFNVTTATIKKL